MMESSVLMQATPEEDGRVKLPPVRQSLEVDRSKPLPTSLQSDFLPEDVLFALTQPPVPRDKLGPPSRTRNLAVTATLPRGPPANLWSHKRRDKFKHLLDTTSCSCGAGKDISFLYDVPQEFSHPEKPDTIDQSAQRSDAEMPPKKSLQLPDTLVPNEYHIVKNKGVMGIEYHQDKYTTNPEDHEKHLVVFPSMKPASRYEVIQLKKTMDNMLEKVGFNDFEADIKGPTQMHNVLELIKKEQNIYNIVFHELIRQTTVECSDRGELLSELRNRYSQLLGKIPQQIMSLHEEVMAQRALDRRLTDELMRFKNTISILTSELSDVKEHDKVVTREAQKTQEDLRTALAEAQKNAALLSEYHDLYELQRRRLEHQVFVLSEEREIWSGAAYSLALKVTEECRLTTAKRLHVSEKSWAKLANHFTILLSDRDTDLLTHIQGHVEKWRDAIEDFNMALRQREEEMKEALTSIKGGVHKWIADFLKFAFNKDGHMVKPPDADKMRSLQADMKTWEKTLSKEAEFFGGDLLLSNQDELSQIRKEMEGWTDNALKVFGRHRGTTGIPHIDQKSMLNLNEEVERLLEQYQHRISGENGVAAIVISLQNVVESWDSRIQAALNGTMRIQESDWSAFYQSLDDWIASIDAATQCVGTTDTEEDRQEGKPHVRRSDKSATSIDIHQVVRKTQKWATTASNSIDSEDAKLVEQVSTLHSEMVRWMVQTLLRLAPDKEGNSQEAAQMALLGSVSVPQLHENAKQLFQSLDTFSSYVTLVGLEAHGFTVVPQWWADNDPEPLMFRLDWQQQQRYKGHDLRWVREEQEAQKIESGAFEPEFENLKYTQKKKKKKKAMTALEEKSLEKDLETKPPPPCCGGIVMENTQKRQDMNEDNADHELRDLKKLRTECEDWIHTAKILMSQLTGESIEELFPKRADTTLSKASTPPDASGAVTFRDHEKLESVEEPSSAPADKPQAPGLLEETQPVTAASELAPATVPDLQEPTREALPSPEVQIVEATVSGLNPTVAEPQAERMEILGGDENTHLTGLQERSPQEMVTSPVTTAGAPDTKKAFEALAAVNSLQDQLIMTEARAQEAEDRAAATDMELAQEQEKVRSLTKQMEKLQKLLGGDQGEGDAPQSASSAQAPPPPVTATPVPPVTALTPSALSPRADSSAGTKKKGTSSGKSSGKSKKK